MPNCLYRLLKSSPYPLFGIAVVPRFVIFHLRYVTQITQAANQFN
jgi:hypothetical protein